MARHEAIAAGQGISGRTTQEENGTGTGVRTKTTKVKRGKLNQERPALVAKECLTNSSQEGEGESVSQSESSGTRKSTRRRKPVDKMGGVMIDNIQGGGEEVEISRGRKQVKLKTHNPGRGMAISIKTQS